MQKALIARGMRDFLPEAMRRRRRVIEILSAVFERFGFEPVETPALERLETLEGKYGEESDRLIYRVLKRGQGGEEGESDLGLRYDLTVPLARLVAMNPDLPLPFRRWQIQPVWRADRPQRGRYREFLQCDVDVVGSSSPVADAECIAVVDAALTALDLGEFEIRVNHRRVLRAMADVTGVGHKETDVLVALDKIERVGREGVDAEWAARGLPPRATARLWALLDLAPAAARPLDALAALEPALSEEGRAAVRDLERILHLVGALGVPEARIRFDPTLARGLDYYTGAVFETVVVAPRIGSLSGGGRYDRLVGTFLGRDIPAVGVSLGLERILAVIEEAGTLGGPTAPARVLVAALDDACLPAALEASARFRAAGQSTWVAPEPLPMKKALRQADRRRIPFAAVVGPDEAAAGTTFLRRMADGAQWVLPAADLLPHLEAGPPTPDATG
ncbi:MAG: histidine--tRNA ligase [Deltaproteobacteria bacterium]|nr:histidine--tRNA ligase [Deltaproteobacteria bacterium]